MRKLFTLVLVLASIYTTTAVAWPTKLATNIWTDSGHKKSALMRCGDCCKHNCWLLDGTYYDSISKFNEKCTDEPPEPSCLDGADYVFENDKCIVKSCPAGYFLGGSVPGCLDCGINYYCPKGSSSRRPCTNAPANAQYVGANVGDSNCPWECKSGYTKSGNSCVKDCVGYNIGDGSFSCVDHTIKGTVTSNGFNWTVKFSYGDVSGEATCNNAGGEGRYSAVPQTGFTVGTTGGFCWCRMTYPQKSNWTYLESPSNCSDECGALCASAVADEEEMRESMYGHLGE